MSTSYVSYGPVASTTAQHDWEPMTMLAKVLDEILNYTQLV